VLVVVVVTNVASVSELEMASDVEALSGEVA